jgi:hypothetical protein
LLVVSVTDGLFSLFNDDDDDDYDNDDNDNDKLSLKVCDWINQYYI